MYTLSTFVILENLDRKLTQISFIDQKNNILESTPHLVSRTLTNTNDNKSNIRVVTIERKDKRVGRWASTSCLVMPLSRNLELFVCALCRYFIYFFTIFDLKRLNPEACKHIYFKMLKIKSKNLDDIKIRW